jgi:hypothetical protein
MNQTDENENKIILRVINYLYLVIVIVGTLANILAFLLFSRKKFQKTVFSTYFRALLVVDTIQLDYLALSKFIFFEYDIHFRDLNIILCRLTMPLAYSLPSASAYITAVISFDRWLSITKPTVLLIRKKKNFKLMFACLSFCIISCSMVNCFSHF